MRNLVAALLTVCALEVPARHADACGVKLTIKSSAPRKSVAHSSNPSEVLLVGKPPRRLERDLSAAGHRVEVTPDAASAPRDTYAVVVVDPADEQAARTRFTHSIIIVRSGDVDSDMRSVEGQVARRPIRTNEGRAVVAARATRTPISAGPRLEAPRRIVAATPAGAETPAVVTLPPTPAPAPVPVPAPAPVAPVAPVRVATVDRPARPEVAPRPSRAAAPVESIQREVFFGLGSTHAGKTAALGRVVRELQASPDLHVTIQGYADPSGSADANMALSQQRAEWVRDYLTSAGIDASRLEVAAFGDTQLKYGAQDGRNRRVAIVSK